MRFNWLLVGSLLFSISLFSHPGFHEPWGKDSDLKAVSSRPVDEKLSLATKMADIVIRFHQEVISPVDGPRSHYRPSSSQYMKLAMHRYGFLKGFIMGCDRLLRENDEEWVYRKIEVDGAIFKYDPAVIDKYL
ncbi:MAG: membrane protein insertion efficiency factor YidD [Chlamydiota bacterium]